MKLNTNKKSLESSGMNINVDFSIDMNGKAFSVLSDGMYSDVVSTIVRELSSNAYDAHVAAGKTDVPFEVTCPNGFDPHFAVKDFGIGLRYYKYSARVINEHEGESTIFIDGDVRSEINNINLIVLDSCNTVRIGAVLFDNTDKQTVIRIPGDYEGEDVSVEFDDALVLYSTYFRSTKEQSNDYIGAFGLGSKTPFAYTDNFLVTNRFNGTERVYNILTNVDSKPQINLMHTQVTTECNGLEVKLAVAPEDYNEFKEAIQSQLVYFDPRPTVLNEAVTFPDITYRGKTFLILEGDGIPEADHSYYRKEARAVVGNNSYTVEKNINSKLFSDQNLVLRFNVGEVMVTASREELKYDEPTLNCITQRETEAIAEYTKYVLESIDTNDMTDYEKAAFLNKNCSVIDLSDPEVVKKVGNSQYIYKKNMILIPITGWGDYVELRYDDVPVLDDNGLPTGAVVRKVNQHKSYYNNKIRWSQYERTKGKTQSVSNGTVNPVTKMLVFIRDNSYSFLKKIAYYLEENVVDEKTEIMVLDLSGDDSENSGSLSALKELVGHNTTFVRLSEIELPKNLSYTPTDRNPTPVARAYTAGDSFESIRMWKDVYTPLTQIDTDAYIVKTHRCSIEGVAYNDYRFLELYIRAGMKYDSNTTILALSRAKYEKALEYGFKPVTELIAKLKQSIKIPVDMVNGQVFTEFYNNLKDRRVVSLFRYFPEEDIAKINPECPIVDILRIKNVIKHRYTDRYDRFINIKRLADLMNIEEKPEVSAFVQKAIDKTNELCDNLVKSMELVKDMGCYPFQHEEKRVALIQYINMLYPTNTGESNE